MEWVSWTKVVVSGELEQRGKSPETRVTIKNQELVLKSGKKDVVKNDIDIMAGDNYSI